MNRVDSVLEHINAARETGVRKKMDAHVGAHGNQATQRVKSSDKEFIPLEKGTARCRVARRVHRLGGLASSRRSDYTGSVSPEEAQESASMVTVEDSAHLTNLQPTGGPYNRPKPAKANFRETGGWSGPTKRTWLK